MYAIAFDFDTDSWKANYHNTSYNNAYGEVRAILEKNGFVWTQGSVYFAKDNSVNAVTCVMTAMELSSKLPYFAKSIKDIRLLRIEEFNDLKPAVDSAKPA